MKRSEINQAIGEAIERIGSVGLFLPAWAYWSPSQWQSVGFEADEIRRHELGWNVTDFGSGDFQNMGLTLFVVRNGRLENDLPITTKTYAEKYMVVKPGQITPWHFHWQKTEDLINRGGGRLEVELAWAGEDELSLSKQEISVQVDGMTKILQAKSSILLECGESVTLVPRMCHQFRGHQQSASVVAGEVSCLNNDYTDNCFLGRNAARTTIEEDESPRYLLSTEYPNAI